MLKHLKIYFPDIPKYYATTATIGAQAYGLVVESHGGRPTKIEGNEKHPSSLGKTNAFLQAEILNLYDPDRAKEVKKDNAYSSWPDFISFWSKKYSEFSKTGGQGLAVVSGEFSSPTLFKLYSAFKKTFPKAIWAVNESIDNSNIYNGIALAAGQTLRPKYNFEKAKVVLSIDNDFLGTGQESVANNLGFSKARKVQSEKDSMNRLYVVESSFSITGGMADHRSQLSQGQMEQFTRQLAAALGIEGSYEETVAAEWLKALVSDLKKNSASSIVIAGNRQSAETHALVYAINAALKNNNSTVTYHKDKYAVLSAGSLADIVAAADSINTLVTLNSNIVYDAPVDIEISKAFNKIENSVCFSPSYDETALAADWHLPASHFLESWGDACAVDGTLSTVQPLIAPLYKSKSSVEMLHLLAKGEDSKGYDIVKETWSGLLGNSSAKAWQKVLHDGVYKNSNKFNSRLRPLAIAKAPASKLSKDNLEVIFHTSPSTYDGRFANNGWLQEMPDPVTKVSWDNMALISPQTAEDLGIKTRDVINLSVNGKSIEIAAYVLPGQAKNTVSLEIGYGRENAGRIADGVGFNVNKLRTTQHYYSATGVKITNTGRTYVLANTQDYISMEGRPLVREATLQEYKNGEGFKPEEIKHPPLKSLWDDHNYEEGYQWGMSIDLNSCTGCNTCVIACQSENNIPVIGKEQVEKGREMAWIRLDRYFAGDLNNPEMVYQPVACQHCENAPCEQVCPVQATLHDSEGLNVMTYNRCVGTRYCANNCPYKVRRFNYFNFTKDMPETIKMAQNPDVTVRFRGVMEKCTYCTQRLQEAKITAKNENRIAKDLDYQSACQQACPADAIVFGNINDPESKVTEVKKQNRNYALLAELNIKPRTTYLAKLRNPNPEIEKLTQTIS